VLRSGSNLSAKTGFRALAAILLCGFLAACATTSQPGAPSKRVERSAVPQQPSLEQPTAQRHHAGPGEPIKIGLLLPMTGRGAAIGKILLESAQMAFFEIGDDRLVLIPRDTGDTPEQAAAATRDLLNQGVEVILGPYFSASVTAAAPIANQAGVNLIAFSNSRDVARPGAYLMGFLPGAEVNRIVDYARSQGLKRFAALIPASPYGTLALQTFQKAVMADGGSLAKIEIYPRDTSGLDDFVRRLGDYDAREKLLAQDKADLRRYGDDDLAHDALADLAQRETLGTVDFDAVFIPEGGIVLRALAPLLPYYDIDPSQIRLLGTGLWDDPNVAREPAMIGGWFAAPEPAAAKVFAARFSKTFGASPPRIASLAYDAVALAAVLSKDPPEKRFSAAAITDPNGFKGVDGVIRFNPDGTSDRGLAVLEVEKTGFDVISPAPNSFRTAEAKPDALEQPGVTKQALK
jgi:ABC-type branched-subunit amino acid transport system substrate-binding protein